MGCMRYDRVGPFTKTDLGTRADKNRQSKGVEAPPRLISAAPDYTSGGSVKKGGGIKVTLESLVVESHHICILRGDRLQDSDITKK